MKTVECIYAMQGQYIKTVLTLPEGATLEEVTAQLTQLPKWQVLDLTECIVSKYGKKCALNDIVADQDRLAYCRPLIIDPKTRRRLLAAQKK